MTILSHPDHGQLVANFYASHHAELVGFVCSRLGNREESEDIVQDVALKMLSLQAPINATTVKAFAYTIAANKVKDALRRRIYRRQAEDSALYEAERAYCPVEQETCYHDTLRLVGEATAHLSPSCARVFTLSLHEGLASGEIAEGLGVSKRTVETQLLTARKKVRAYVRAAI